MNKVKKTSLKELKVQSFRTTLSKDEKKAVKGGRPMAAVGITYLRVYC